MPTKLTIEQIVGLDQAIKDIRTLEPKLYGFLKENGDEAGMRKMMQSLSTIESLSRVLMGSELSVRS